MKTSRDRGCDALCENVESAAHLTLLGCAVVTLTLLAGVGYLVASSGMPAPELVQALTTLEVPADSWHEDMIFLWWSFYFVLTGCLFAYGAYGFLSGSLSAHLLRKIEAMRREPEDADLAAQVATFHEHFHLAQATKHWVLGVVYCAILLSASLASQNSVTPVPHLWYVTVLCAVFATSGLVWNRTRVFRGREVRADATGLGASSSDR